MPNTPRKIYNLGGGSVLTANQLAAYDELIDAGEEEYFVQAINKILLTASQRDFLADQHLQIADVLNGRFYGHQEASVLAIFDDWNARLGRKEYGF